jgi:hypothetical protein
VTASPPPLRIASAAQSAGSGATAIRGVAA